VEICAEVRLGLGPDYMYADTGWLIRGWMEITASDHKCVLEMWRE